MKNQGLFPNNTEKNPIEHVRAITLKSEKEIEVPSNFKVHEEKEKEDRLKIETSRDEETKSNKEGNTNPRKRRRL